MRNTIDKIFNINVIKLSDTEVLEYLNIYKTSPSLLARKHAKECLISNFIKLIVSIAYKFANNYGNIEDLVYEGIAGFCIAIDKYDTSKQVKLGTYAYMWILQTIERKIGLINEIYVPEEVCILSRKINEVNEQYQQEHGGLKPSREYIANVLNVPLLKVNNAINASKAIYSLDNVITSETESCFGDMIQDDNDINQQLIKEETNNNIHTILKSLLSPNEYYVLKHFMGLNNCNKMQLNEIAKKLHLSESRIKQMKLKALNKLKVNKSLFVCWY